MKISEIVEALQYFFLDIIGVFIPGFFLIAGIFYLFKVPIDLQSFSGAYPGLIMLLASYALGHMVTSISNTVFIPLFSFIAAICRKIPIINKLVPVSIKNRKELNDEILSSDPYNEFINLLRATQFFPDVCKNGFYDSRNVNYWRNIALTIASDEKSVIYKFMFISLLNSGIGTVLSMLSLTWISVHILNQFFATSLSVVPINWWIWVIMLIISLPFFERNATFYGMSMRLPFVTGSVKLAEKFRGQIFSTESVPNLQKQKGKPRLYLGGGFKSGWQDLVINKISAFDFYDPRSHNIANEKEYTIWDLEAIRNCDWILAYFEKTNPAGFALALEIGFAKALNKKIILVDEKSSDDTSRKYFGMVNSTADVIFYSLEEAIVYLQKLEMLYLTKS